MEHKKCSKCKEEKPINNFSKNQSWCKSCKKEYRKNNKDKIKNYGDTYYKNNKQKIKDYGVNNKEKTSLREREFRENNVACYLYNLAKKRAKKRANKKNREFDIEINDIKICQFCPLLNIKMQINNTYLKDNSFSLDRIDNNKGYIKNNIWVISHKANRSKYNSTIEEYEFLVNKLSKNEKIIGNGAYCNFGKIVCEIKRKCKNNNIDFNISKDYLKSIYPKNNKCSLLNIELIKGKGTEDNHPTLDRIIPKKGYVEGNVMFVSRRANTIKNNLSLNEMILLLSNWKTKLINI